MSTDNVVALRANGGPIIDRRASQIENAALTVKNARSVVIAILHADSTELLEDDDRSDALWVVHGLLSDAVRTLEPDEASTPAAPETPEGGAS